MVGAAALLEALLIRRRVEEALVWTVLED
jgi:hypothetical protein